LLSVLNEVVKIEEKSANTYKPKSRKELEKELKQLEQQMRDFAKDLEFEKAAAVRDKIGQLKEHLLQI